MSVAIGQLLAFLKIGAVAAVIMAGLWLIIRVVEKNGRDEGDGNGPA